MQVSREKMTTALRMDGSLMLICEVEYFSPGVRISVEPADDEDATMEDEETKIETNIRENNKRMLDSELFTDCVIKVGHFWLRVHCYTPLAFPEGFRFFSCFFCAHLGQ